MGAKETIRKGVSILILVGLVFALLLPAGGAGAASFSATPADHAVQFLYQEYAAKGAKNADAGVGSYAYYVLSRAGVGVSGWVYSGQSLVDAVYGLIEKDLTGADQTSAKLLVQDLLAARAMGKQDLATQLLNVLKNRHSEKGFDSGPFSLFSNVSAYELLGRAGLLAEFSTAKEYLLSTQNAVYGTWGYEWEGQYYPDFMATAQAVRALRFLDPKGSDFQIQGALDAGLKWLMAQQQSNGSFVTGWDDPLVDTAEAILTLKLVGRDSGEAWEKAKGYLLDNAVKPDGTLGGAGNAMDATWLLAACHELGIEPVVWRFYLDPEVLELAVGQQKQLRAFWEGPGGPSEVTAQASWRSENDAIAEVSQTGLVKAKSTGSTVVKAVYGGLVAQSRLTVQGQSGGGVYKGVSVGLAIVGAGGELIYGPSYLTVTSDNRWGLTALGALDASGVSYTVKETAWGPFVDSIEGIASSGTAGWMYTVNGQIPMVGADKYEVKEKDKVIWYYSKSMEQEPPKWEDLVKQGSTTSALSETQKRSIEEALKNLKGEKPDLSKALDVLAQVAKLKEADFTAELKAKAAELISALMPFLSKLPDKAVGVQVRGEGAEVRLDGHSIISQADMMRRAAELGEMLKSKGVAGAENLAPKVLVAQLPQEIADKDFTALLPAEAAKALVSNGFTFELASKEVTFTLPAKAVNTLLGAGSNVAQMAVSASRINPDKVILPKGTFVVAGKIMNLDLEAVTPEGVKKKPKTNFAEKITVTVSLEGIDITKVNVKDLAVYRQRKDGSWEYVGGSISPDGKSISFQTASTSVYAILYYHQTFADISSHWAKKEIEFMARRLIARGMTENSFVPEAPVTRAQFAAFLVRLLGLEEYKPAVPVFTDLPPEHWAYRAVAAAAKAGLVKGTGENTFAPEREITREEIAVMLSRVLEQKGLAPKVEEKETNALLAHYSDGGKVSTWARKAVAAAIKGGLLSGREPKVLAPQDKATRAEAMVLLKRFGDSLEG